jgi:hypothetical protein
VPYIVIYGPIGAKSKELKNMVATQVDIKLIKSSENYIH